MPIFAIFSFFFRGLEARQGKIFVSFVFQTVPLEMRGGGGGIKSTKTNQNEASYSVCHPGALGRKLLTARVPLIHFKRIFEISVFIF